MREEEAVNVALVAWNSGIDAFIERLAPDVEWHAPDEDGRNWDMNGYLGPTDYATQVRVLINSLRREYRLADDPARFWMSP